MAAVAQNGMVSDDQFAENCPSPTKFSESDTQKCLDSKSEFQKNMNELADLLSKLNPLAKEFVPSSFRVKNDLSSSDDHFPVAHKNSGADNSPNNRRVI